MNISVVFNAALKSAMTEAGHVLRGSGRTIELTPREFSVLEALMLSAGRVLTKEQLEARMYEWDKTVESNTLEVYIHFLRRKLSPEAIRTVRGVGYLVPRPTPQTARD